MWIVGTLLGLLAAPEAMAARARTGTEVAVVGVHLPQQTDETSLSASLALVEALDAAGVVGLSPEAVHARLAGRESLVVDGAALGPGRRKREEGRILYDRADFEGAIPVLEEAVQALGDGLSGSGDPRELVQALLLLGQARWSTGDTDGAKQAFSQVVVLEPSWQLDAVNYPPKIVSFFNDVRYEVLARPKGRLQLQVPDRNRVLLDGREALSGTVELIAGLHFALVSGPEGERSFHQVRLEPGETEVLTARPSARSLGLADPTAAGRSAQIRLLYQSLGTHVGAPLVLLGGQLEGGKVGAQLYETRTGSFSRIETAPAGSDPVAALVGLVPSVLDDLTEAGNLRTDRISFDVAAFDQDTDPTLSALLLDPTPLVAFETERRRPSWIVWATVGTVAVGGAAVAVATLATVNGEDPKPEPTPDTGPEGVILVGPIP